MALHPNFPKSPYAPLIPEQRWFPADETLRATAHEKLLPPLVAKIRQDVHAWRKMARLKQWCADAAAAGENGRRYDFVFVDQTGFEKHAPKNFAALAASFTEYKS